MKHRIRAIKFHPGTNDGPVECGDCPWWGPASEWEAHKTGVSANECRNRHNGPWYVDSAGYRRCLTCVRQQKRDYLARRRERHQAALAGLHA